MHLLQFALIFALFAFAIGFSCPSKNQVPKVGKICLSDRDCGVGKCCNDMKNTKSCIMAASQDHYLGGTDGKYGSEVLSL